MINYAKRATAKSPKNLASVGRRRRKSLKRKRRFSLSTKTTCNRVRIGSAQLSIRMLMKHYGSGALAAENPTFLLTADAAGGSFANCRKAGNKWLNRLKWMAATF